MRHSWLTFVVLAIIAVAIPERPAAASPSQPTIITPAEGSRALPMPAEAEARPRRCGAAGALMILGVGLLGILLGPVWLAYVLGRRGLAKRYPAEPVSLLVAGEVTHRQLRWYVLWSAMQLAAVIGLFAAGSDIMPFFIALFATNTLCRLAYAHGVRRFLERSDATAVRHGPWLFVSADRKTLKLLASHEDFVQAKRAGIPSAALQRSN